MYLIYGYERKTFWRSYEYTEDRLDNAGVDDLKKAFSSLKQDRLAVIKFERGPVAVSILYDTYSDFERGVLTACTFTLPNSKDRVQASYSAMRRACINLFTGAAETITF